MRNLRLTLEGEYWDSLLYKGQLHLFGIDGSLAVYNWEQLIEDLSSDIGDGADMALRFAFSESNAVYRSQMNLASLRDCFDRLAQTSFEVSARRLDRYRLVQGDNRFPFPHNSSAFHYDRLVVATTRGVFAGHYDPDTHERSAAARLFATGSNQAWPSYGSVAIAAGSEGLFQVDLGVGQKTLPDEQDGDSLSSRSCDACDWMYGNIIGVSFEEGSVLARFALPSNRVLARSKDDITLKNVEDSDEAGDGATRHHRDMQKVDILSAVLSNPRHVSSKALTWGSRDKIYRVEGKQLAVFRLLSDGRTPRIGTVDLPQGLNTLVSVQTALFGIVFEFDEYLLALTSDGKVHKIVGEPTNWRVFPRSRRYENHLHVLRDDVLDIHSFNQDVEQDQYEKLIGTRVPDAWRRE